MTRGELAAQARIALANGEAVIAAICEHMIEHGGTVRQEHGKRIVRFANSCVRFTCETGAVLVDVTAAGLEDLYFIRMTVAAHMLEFADKPSPDIDWTGDGGDLARPPNFQILTVVGLHSLTPHMRRITFSGPDIARFSPMTALHLNILLQHPDLDEPQWPSVGSNGLVRWEDPERRPSFRKYTVRALDPAAGTLAIDFLLHADAGPGSAFARSAKAGDQLGVVGPGGGGLIEADWYLFAGDETALPAIGRMLEHLPGHARGKALIEVANEGEIQHLNSSAAIEVEWLFRDRAPGGMTQLLADAVRRAPFPQDGSTVYAWAGCEFDDFRSIRSFLRKERGLTTREHLVVSYWRRGAAEGSGSS